MSLFGHRILKTLSHLLTSLLILKIVGKGENTANPMIFSFSNNTFYPFRDNQLINFTLYQMTNLLSSKLKEFADDNFKFYKNGRKFSKRVENTVGKGEIA